MLTKQSEMQSQVILISSLNKGVLNSYKNGNIIFLRTPFKDAKE